jgi:hypothetical protein
MSTTLTHFTETASQTGGPYVHIGLAPKQAGFEIFDNNFGNVLTKPDTKGERIRIEGKVFDGTGSEVRDVLIEIWQANAAGKYAHPSDTQDKPLDPSFRGWGRTTPLRRSSPAPCPAMAAQRRRRTLPSFCLRAASTLACTPACTLTTRPRRMPRTR